MPHLVKSVYDGNIPVQEILPVLKNRTISGKTSAIMAEYLEGVVSEGSGKQAYIEGYKVGGKTGTAQKYENGTIARGKYVSSFFGTYPALNPKYALLVCVNEPSSGAYYGSVVASPYGKQIFEGLFRYKNIPKDFETQEDFFVIPNICGLPLSQAIIALDKQNINYEISGDGGLVVSQFPISGTKVAKGGYIVINTN